VVTARLCISGEASAARLFVSVRWVSVQHRTRAQCAARATADDVRVDASFTTKHQICQRALPADDAASGSL